MKIDKLKSLLDLSLLSHTKNKMTLFDREGTILISPNEHYWKKHFWRENSIINLLTSLDMITIKD